MKVLILGASGFLGEILYKKIKEETDFWVLGTYNESKINNELIKLNVGNLIEVKTFLEHFKVDVVIWCIIEKIDEKELINTGLSNIFNNINKSCKFIYMSTNTVPGESENLVSKLDNYTIIKAGIEIDKLQQTIINIISTNFIGG